jgi:putative PIN family toxin of toxin-antitoxin system
VSTPRIVLDSSVFVSAFLAKTGAAARVLDLALTESVYLSVSEAIIAETRNVLLTYERIRQRYTYTDDDVEGFCARLGQAFTLLTVFPSVSGVCRDPNDDMVLACAMAAEAQYLVTRDKDLLVLQQYEGIAIVTPEAFLEWLRSTLP